MDCVGLDLQYWDLVKDDISKALDDSLTIDDMYQLIKSRDVQLWTLHQGKAVMTTEIVTYPQYKAVRIFTVTGQDMHLWLDDLIETVSAWAKAQGCTSMNFCGRRGWEKVLAKKGFGDTKIVMSKGII